LTEAYRIGPLLLDAETCVLTRAGVPVRLGKRAVTVFAALVRSAREYVPKARLIEAAWPGLVVQESNLAVQILAIRRVLAEVSSGEAWLETLERRGYRFVGPVIPLTGPAANALGPVLPSSNLPDVLTSFVGRRKELAELHKLLASSRLLTLTGAGGVGKTRLALQVAADIRNDLSHGVWFVDLAPLVDSTLVAKAIAQTLSVMEVAGEPLADTLCSRLRATRALLILDNCEHLIEPCARLAECLLRSAPDLRILATSREALHIAGEQCYQLAPLSLPPASASLEEMFRSDAVQLFVERTRLRQPGFALTAKRAPAVAELCVRLDGMPLALELAAARVTVLPLEKIVERLTDRFRLLTRGNRNALPRQQTLRAAIGWSFDLLSEAARTLIARLSVFAGGFDLEAAEAVAAGGRLAQDDVLDLLSSLVDKSLVVTESEGERYRLLDTIREYAHERLQAAGEEAAVREQHFRWCLRLAERAEPALLGGPRQKPALDRLAAEHDNLRAALTWANETPDRSASALRLCGMLYRFWSRRGYWREGYAWCMKALAQESRPGDEAARAKVLLTAGSLGNNVPGAETRILLEKALVLSREAGDAGTEAVTLNNLARVLDWDVDLSRARSLLEQAREINRELGDETLELHNMSNLVNVLRRQREPAAALALAEEGLATSRASGNRWLEAIFMYLLGRIALDRGDIVSAQRFNQGALAIAVELVMPDWQSFSLVKLGFLDVVRGDAASARCHLTEAVDISRRFGGRLNLAECFNAMGVLASHTGRHDQAARLWGVAEAMLGSLVSSDVLEREFLDPYHARSRDVLGDAAYDVAVAEGRQLPREAAIDGAIAWLAGGP
jgi:predicted ATPase/DNA-binding winged helix-turn-helix (wHTH) protein